MEIKEKHLGLMIESSYIYYVQMRKEIDSEKITKVGKVSVSATGIFPQNPLLSTFDGYN